MSQFTTFITMASDNNIWDISNVVTSIDGLERFVVSH